MKIKERKKLCICLDGSALAKLSNKEYWPPFSFHNIVHNKN